MPETERREIDRSGFALMQWWMPADQYNIAADVMEEYGRAFQIYVARSRKYGNQWVQAGWRDNLMHVLSKTLRVSKLLEEDDTNPKEHIDDLQDLVNYAIFAIINMKAERQHAGLEVLMSIFEAEEEATEWQADPALEGEDRRPPPIVNEETGEGKEPEKPEGKLWGPEVDAWREGFNEIREQRGF